MRSLIYDTVDVSQSSLTLHTCEDSKTLIRAMGNFRLTPINDGIEIGQLTLGIAPGTVDVSGASAGSQSLDSPVALQEILRMPFHGHRDETSGQVQYMGDSVQFDSKAQRKLKEGDLVRLYHDGITGSILTISGIVYLWFKE